MENYEQFKELMQKSGSVALATCGLKGLPNVRLVAYIWDDQAKKLYFFSHNQTTKVAELKANPAVSLMTIPFDETVRTVKIDQAQAVVSTKKIADLASAVVAKYPYLKDHLAGDTSAYILYEVTFNKALLKLGFGKSIEIDL